MRIWISSLGRERLYLQIHRLSYKRSHIRSAPSRAGLPDTSGYRHRRVGRAGQRNLEQIPSRAVHSPFRGLRQDERLSYRRVSRRKPGRPRPAFRPPGQRRQDRHFHILMPESARFFADYPYISLYGNYRADQAFQIRHIGADGQRPGGSDRRLRLFLRRDVLYAARPARRAGPHQACQIGPGIRRGGEDILRRRRMPYSRHQLRGNRAPGGQALS